MDNVSPRITGHIYFWNSVLLMYYNVTSVRSVMYILYLENVLDGVVYAKFTNN